MRNIRFPFFAPYLTVNCYFQVTKLQESHEYGFRVRAENIAGPGKYSKVSDPAIARDAVDAPGDLDIVDITKNSARIIWEKPEYDGGARITGN